MKFLEFLRCQPMRTAARTYRGTKQTFVGIDVADAMQQLLIQQRCFDKRCALSKQRREFSKLNGQRFGTRPSESTGADFQTAKTPGVDEPQLTSGSKLGDQMGMLLDFRFGRCDDHASSHA